MFYGREKELEDLTAQYDNEMSAVTLVYGNEGIGKTSLIKKFLRGKKYIYYNTYPLSEKMARESIQEKIFDVLDDNESLKVVVVENFENLSKVYDTFFESVGKIIDSGRKIMFLLTSSSVYWVENSMVELLSDRTDLISTAMKIKELPFVQVAKQYPDYSVEELLKLYAITGGVPKYLKYIDPAVSVKENVIKLMIADDAPLRNVGIDMVSRELRETSVYNSILSCLAKGMNKLNDLYETLELGRDKISVYLKNLIDRGIVEKIFSFETSGSRNTKKGMYRISVPIVEFWYRYIYNHSSEVEITESLTFYNEYIKNDLKSLLNETMIKVANEYIDFLSEYKALPAEVEHKGRWYGKNGDIDIVARDINGDYIVCQCFYSARQMSYDEYERLLELQKYSEISAKYIYLFSVSGFDLKLKRLSEEMEGLVLVNVNEM